MYAYSESFVINVYRLFIGLCRYFDIGESSFRYAWAERRESFKRGREGGRKIFAKVIKPDI